MSNIHIELTGSGKCKIIHQTNGKEIQTQMMQLNPDSKFEYSSTDLLAAALGSCIGSSLENMLIRNHIELSKVKIDVKKEINTKLRLPSFIVRIKFPIDQPSSLELKKFRRAAGSCMVHRSLSDEINLDIQFLWKNIQTLS